MKNLLSILLGTTLSFSAWGATVAKTEDQSKAEKHANTQVQQKVTEKRKEILQDATMAMNQTKNALKMLDEGNKKGAIDALESATGKLELIVAREPKLSLAAFDYNVETREILNDLKSVKNIKDQAEDLLEDDRVQEAAALLANLKSEMVISVANIPLATYPAAMKEAARLIDQNKTDEAKDVIAAALGTVVVTENIIPLPVARAEYLLNESEKLAEKKNRSKDENKRLNTLMDDARKELQFAEELGYGQKEDFKNLYAQLDDVLKKTEGGKSGSGWFNDVKRSISGIFDDSDSSKDEKQAQEDSK
jgi:hypothetical protein